MPSLLNLLGNTLINNKKEKIDTSTLAKPNLVVGLYFAAYCPPAKPFTTLLANFYLNFPTDGINGKQLEIVYVSSDCEEDDYNAFTSGMPWLAIPFDNQAIIVKLLKKYGLVDMPALVFIHGETGQLITVDGRDRLSEDLDGKEFPWVRKCLNEILKGDLLRNKEKVKSEDALKDCVKGFYFSAHWCPPCRIFTPQLKAAYEKVKAAGHKFEIVFISADRSSDSFDSYYLTMPWLAVPYLDPRIKQLTRHFDIHGIPCLVMVDVNNEIINKNARGDVMADLEGKKFPWRPPAVEELSFDHTAALSQSACLIFFTEGDSTLIGQAGDLMEGAAEQYQQEFNQLKDSDDEIPSLKFFYEGTQSDEVADSLRSLTQLDGRKPVLAILDSISGRTFSAPEGDVSKESLDQLIADFKALSAFDASCAAESSQSSSTANDTTT